MRDRRLLGFNVLGGEFGRVRLLADSAVYPSRLGRTRRLVALLACGLATWLAQACGHQDLVAIKPAGTGGTSSCKGNPCSFADQGHFEQCCDGTYCNGTTCIPFDAGTCLDFAKPCSSDYSCCGPCETVAQGAKLCVGYTCQRLSAPCSRDAECCSLSCQNETCSDGRPCLVQGKQCGTDDDCCSKKCNAGSCDNPTGTCAVIGDVCKVNDDCCSKKCVDVGNGSRCLNTGWSTCGGLEPSGETCNQSYQCCSTTCTGGRCAPSCTNPPGICNTTAPDECCTKYCIEPATGAGPGTCSPCFPANRTCWVDENCCSGKCLPDYTCAPY